MLPALIGSGALCQIDHAWIEVHDGHISAHKPLAKAAGVAELGTSFTAVVRYLLTTARESGYCKAVVEFDDDETYLNDPVPLPGN